MKKYILSLLFIMIFLYNFNDISLAEGINAEDKTRVIVYYKDSSIENNVDLFHKAEQVEQKVTDNIYEIIELPTTEVDLWIKEVEKDNSVISVEKEQPLFTLSIPNDPKFKSQEIDFNRLRVVEAWDNYKPQKKIKVAVIDSGVKLDHPDLKNSLINGKNFITEGLPIDYDGHGTHVAGIIGAQTNNNTGIASISKGMVEIMPLKVFHQNKGTTLELKEAIIYAVDNGAEIINMSLGFYDYSEYVHDAVKYAYENDVLMFAAAGNDGQERVAYPAAFKEVTAVAAMDSTTNEKASFSNYGAEIEVVAPGENVYSTWHDNSKLYSSARGTSMSAPYVSSLAALLKAHQPSLIDLQIRQIMKEAAISLNSHFGLLGSGAIDVKNSLNLIEQKNRIYGKNSVQTSVEIAKTGWGEGVNLATLNDKEGNFAVLSTNQSFPDSLTGTTLAYQLNAPLLLTNPNLLDEQLLASLQEFEVTDIVLLGGKVAISETVEDELEKEFTIHRIEGKNRYETNTMINRALERKSSEVIIASGENFPDALAVAPFASQNGIPIILVKQNSIPEDSLDYLNSISYTNAIVLGGELAISNNVLKQLKNPVRISGSSRYDTAIQINDYFNESGEKLLFASGENFRDALAGANLAAKKDMIMVLVQSNKLPVPTENYIDRKVSNNNSVLSFHILGGPVAINSTVAWDIDRIINYRGYYDGLQNMEKTSLN
ncbi:cell wall-binding repeat-containing protein [Alkalihalobacillus sp. BA299]|uniref:cell wall-binding repeat-containing protein n=1 Tax=Alkalihalobacillus sp. BA299 TaxID=2815938 RepID=UPI001ADD3AA7|nr:cell wall-binding repeat-containing protein [Alkalihalobacillus sp. BA299]